MRVFLCALTLCTLAAIAVGQKRTQPSSQAVDQSKFASHAVVADYDERVARCKQNPTDNVNCITLKTTGGDMGIARVCPGAPEDDQNRLTVFSGNLLTLDGLSLEDFEKMGWCKLSADETIKLYLWHLSRMPSRAYYDISKRADRRIYIDVAFEQGTPDIAKSVFRSAMRQVSDVEIVDDFDADFGIDVGVSTAMSASNAQLGYASLTTCTTIEKTPGNSPSASYKKLVDCEHFAPMLNLMGPDDIDSTMRKVVATIDTSEFEAFRKTWPYNKDSGTK